MQRTSPNRLQQLVAWPAAALGLALLGVGLLLPDSIQWRLQLLTGLWLLSLLPRAGMRGTPAPARTFAHLALVCCLGLAAVGLQLTREQVSQAPATRARVAALRQDTARPDEQPVRPGDRTALGSGRLWPVATSTITRGQILDRNGTVLATTQDGQRVYPNPDLGQIVGFQSRLYGVSGIEATYDDALAGTAALSPTALLQAQLLGTALPDAAGADVVLTLDSGLQQAAQAALGERAGAVVLLDTQTGAILALAGYPRFDPNTLILPDNASQADVDRVQAAWAELNNRGDSPLLNRATQGRYPPGSVIKTLTAAAALDAGVVSGPEGQVTCPNRLETEAGAPPVRNAVENLDRRTGSPSDLYRVFAFSCNTAFAQLGLGLGPERFADYAARFGLGFADVVSRTADLRDIPADAGTIANDAAFLARPVALADTAFGQGQALVTPLDMAQMAAVIANDGKLLRPYLVQEVRSGGQAQHQAQPEVLREVIAPQAAQQLRAVMQRSVEIGYAAPVALPGVTIGAKTGTAETSTGTPHSWFVALAPVEQPRFAIAVIVEYGGEGSRGALPVAREVLAAALGVQP
jgi:peptidoglycan glycosyltransferase